MEDLLKTEMLGYINAKRPKDLPEWTITPVVNSEDIQEKVFDIVDLRGYVGTIKRSEGQGEATYYNGDDQHLYLLCFVKFEEFLNQFRIYNQSGQIEKDWAKRLSRADYLVYDKATTKRCFIIHELSSGSINNKRKDGKIQLLNTVRMLCEMPNIKGFIDTFNERLCFVSARGCVASTPMGMADDFMEIYRHLPDPLPINNSSITSRGFLAFESNVVKL